MSFSDLPAQGPLSLGAVYQRAALHDRFGGNPTAGIVPSSKEHAVLLFHTHEGSQQFYGDDFDANGVYWYSGMGAEGDMEWNFANRAVRDHLANGCDLLLFERFRRQGGLWTYSHLMCCVGWKEEPRADRTGNPRKAIIFGLLAVETLPASPAAPGDSRMDLVAMRSRATASAPGAGAPSTQRIQEVYQRSAAVRDYVLARANGFCEACLQAAPFLRADDTPYLEAHHIDRVADGGPDWPDRVAAVCPNCHRRCHYSTDASSFNDQVRRHVASKEAAFTGSQATPERPPTATGTL